MKSFFKKLWARLVNPSPKLLAVAYVLTAIFIAGAISIVIIGFNELPLSVIAYVIFGLAAISLAYTVYTVVRFSPDIKRGIISAMRKSRFLSRLLDQYSFRTLVFASLSFIINIAYVAFHIVIAAIAGSIWYASLAGYYILLTVMRGGIVLYHRKTLKGNDLSPVLEIRRYRISGVLLVLMPLCLSAAIAEMVINGGGFRYNGLVIYAVAAYTFYKITMAIINFIKAKKSYGISIEAIRNIGLADALVSVLALQTAMFHSFGASDMNPAAANALTGAGVCAVTVAIGVIMIVNSVKYKRNLNNETGNE